MLGAQKMMFEELVFFGDEMLERTRTEMHLFSEFVAKMAGAHSVRDIRTMCQECGQHQLDFFRRDSERLFRHGERMIAATSNLISGRRSELIGQMPGDYVRHRSRRVHPAEHDLSRARLFRR